MFEIWKKIISIRKIKANELNDDYDYSSYENNNKNKLGINNNINKDINTNNIDKGINEYSVEMTKIK